MNITEIPAAEAEDNLRLKRAQEQITYCREKENEARRLLAEATESSKRAKEKYEALFAECEKRAVARRKSGQIIVSPSY